MSTCGTYSGAQRHMRRKEPLCDPCREARNAYQSALRKRNPVMIERATRARLIRSRVLTILAQRHPTEYQMIWEKVVDAS